RLLRMSLRAIPCSSSKLLEYFLGLVQMKNEEISSHVEYCQ
ncbi:MAG: hypothetical protein ACI9ZX_000710, partial [Algoriphagus sp.]